MHDGFRHEFQERINMDLVSIDRKWIFVIVVNHCVRLSFDRVAFDWVVNGLTVAYGRSILSASSRMEKLSIK